MVFVVFDMKASTLELLINAIKCEKSFCAIMESFNLSLIITMGKEKSEAEFDVTMGC